MADSKAVVFTGPGQVAFERVAVPSPGPDEVLVRTWWSWISNGTEGSYLRGERADGETPATAERPAPFPLVPGYQRVGEVVAAGAESGFEPGEAVFVTISRVDGLALAYGGHVACAPANRSQVRRLPGDGETRPEAYSGLVLTQVGYNCGIRPPVEAGDVAVVVGDGLVGHWSAQTLAHRGARVLLLGRHRDRLARFAPATPTGCAGVLVTQGGEREQVAALAPEGIAIVVDTVGSVPTLDRLFPLLRPNGHLVSAGYHGPHGSIDIQLLRKREATLHAPSGWNGPRLDATLEGVRTGWLQTLPLVTHRFAAEQAAEAWRCIREERDRTLGVLLDWRGIDS